MESFTRRDILRIAALAGVSAAAPAVAARARTPVLFVSHGAPTVAVEESPYTKALASFGKSAGAPRAVVMVSAHWETSGGVRVTGSAEPRTIHDFGGFPDELYRLRYPAPGAPKLAAEIVQRLTAAGVTAAVDPERGLDHGAWVPLLHALPRADVPVLQVSLPRSRSPKDVLALGAVLEPLREEGVLLAASGGLVHNLGRLDWSGGGGVFPWAAAADAWIAERIENGQVDALLDYPVRMPDARLAAPTTEHLDPVFFALGAAAEGDRVKTVFSGFTFGSLSMRTFSLSA